MSSSSISPDDFRAAAETHQELGPEYQNAVIESFLDKVGREIDARVDARLAYGQQAHQGFAPAPKQPIKPKQQWQPPQQHEHHSNGASLALPIISMVLGIPLTAISVSAGSHPAGLTGLLIIWIGIVAINVAYALSRRSR